jgi:hypothetical protein
MFESGFQHFIVSQNANLVFASWRFFCQKGSDDSESDITKVLQQT